MCNRFYNKPVETGLGPVFHFFAKVRQLHLDWPKPTWGNWQLRSGLFWSGCGPVVVFVGLATGLLNPDQMCMLDIPDGHGTGWYILYAPDSISYSPPISIAPYQLLAHPSPLCLIYWPTRLHCTLSIVGPLVSIVLHIPAHPSPSHTAIHNLLYSTLLYYHLYYIPWAHPFALDTHHPLAHPSIMVQLLPWAHMGWPVSIGTLSPLAVRLRRV
jgi:hypothetical protein